MQNLRGIALVVFAMAAFAVEDALVKSLTQRLPVGEVLAAVGFGGSLVFLVIAGGGGRAWIVRGLRHRTVVVRALSEGVSGATFATALSLVPISTVAAVFQATPLAVTAGAAMFLAEPVGWRRWSAVMAGFAGVLLIIRPGLEGFQPATALVLLSVLSVAFRDLVTRHVPARVPSAVISFHGFFVAFLTGLAMLAFGQPPVAPGLPDFARLTAAIASGAAGYYSIVAAMRLADASALMPFRYSRLLFSLVIGVLVFREHPDAATLVGASIVLAAAFYTYMRERRVATATPPAPAVE